MAKLNPKIKTLINTVKECAKDVYQQLGPGWNEGIYQKAMEVALRERKVAYETQRILPITFSGHVIGESIPDLVIWLPLKGKRTAIVIDLKWEPYLKAEHHSQVAKYIQELKKQVKKKEEVLNIGIVINFAKEKSEKIENGFEEFIKGKVQILEVKV